MSYALRLVDDARRALLELPLEVQEEALDVLENMADEADPAQSASLQLVIHRTEREAVYVLIYCTMEHDIRRLTVDRIVAAIAGGE